ncbi:MAG: DUF2849 domain-containing protein [Halocynthiibacter sp.]
MTNENKPKVITANDLLSGEVMYFGATGIWVEHLHDAAVFLTEEDQNAALLKANSSSRDMVGVYPIDVIKSENGARAVHFRERFRAQGPTNYHHGKHAQLRA